MIYQKGAFRRLFLLLALLPATASGLNCPAPAYDESAVVRKVHDGDTVWLEDGRKIRLIGINAPELARDGKTAEAYATEARDHLRQRLQASDNRVQLVFGEERADRYQRGLAHLFLPDGLNLQADLIEQGLAMASTWPPNTAFSRCYHQLEAGPRCANKGLWAGAGARVQPGARIADPATGFHRLVGRIDRVSASSKGIWIFMEGGLMLGVHNAELANFDKQVLFNLKGRIIQVRGWLKSKRGKDSATKFYLRLRHPSAIEWISETDNIPKC